jgi:hypothetical protein
MLEIDALSLAWIVTILGVCVSAILGFMMLLLWRQMTAMNENLVSVAVRLDNAIPPVGDTINPNLFANAGTVG